MFRLILFASAMIAAAFLWAAPAQAQATRTWVSGVGDDANPCSRTAPCKTFAGAISKTATKGEINCLDPGGFGAVTITKAISIVCYNTLGGILAAGSNGIIVNITNTATGDQVMIDGLDIDGAGTGINGVRIISAAKVYIRNTTIRGFTQNAVQLNGPAGARLFGEELTITSSNIGINIQGTAGASNNAIIERTQVDANATSSIKIVGPGSIILSGVTLAGSGVSIDATGGAQVISYGNNIFRGTGLPTQTLPLQ